MYKGYIMQISNIDYDIILLCMLCVCVHMDITVCIWRSEDNLQETVFYPVTLRAQTQELIFGGKCLPDEPSPSPMV